MMTLQDYSLNNDNQIKGMVLSFAGYKNITVTFKGYYIEDNDKTGSFSAQPFYESYVMYREQNPYKKIDHVRYFFELSKGDDTYMLTGHWNGN
jgi:hypothetical protein